MSGEAAMLADDGRQDGGGGEWAMGWPQTPEAFEQLVEAFQHRLVWHAFQRVGNSADAEDIVQTVFLRAFAERKRLSEVHNVGAYLFRMTANACTDHLRRNKRIFVPIDKARIEQIPAPAAHPDEQLAARELARIEAHLARLPHRQAEVLRLLFFDDLSLKDISATLNCTLATVKSRLRYGLQKMRRTLKSKEVE